MMISSSEVSTKWKSVIQPVEVSACSNKSDRIRTESTPPAGSSKTLTGTLAKVDQGCTQQPCHMDAGFCAAEMSLAI